VIANQNITTDSGALISIFIHNDKIFYSDTPENVRMLL
jgi:hypothetical protein